MVILTVFGGLLIDTGRGGGVAVVLKCKFDIFSHDMSEIPSLNANPRLMSFPRPYLSLARSSSKDLRRYETAKSMKRRIFNGKSACRA